MDGSNCQDNAGPGEIGESTTAIGCWKNIWLGLNDAVGLGERARPERSQPAP